MLTQPTQKNKSEMVVVSYKRIAIVPTKLDTVRLLLGQLNLRVIPQRRYTNTNNYGLKLNRKKYGIGSSPGPVWINPTQQSYPTSDKVQE